MTFFFLVVGLEAKREIDLGQLRERRRMALTVRRGARRDGGADRDLPGVQRRRLRRARLGRGDVHRHGVRARRARAVARGGTRLRVRLLTLAVFDDLVALIVIATVYTDTSTFVRCWWRGRTLRGRCSRCASCPRAWRLPVAAVVGVAVWVAL